MKLLKLTIPSGYKMLEKGFSINFLTKTRINKALTSNDLMQLEKGLYYPLETIFIGKNSSGKTTVLFLIHLILEFLKTGRIPSSYLCEQDRFELNVIFYSGGFIYLFEGSFVKSNLLNHNEFMLIEKESLKRTTYKKTYMKDLSNISFRKENLISSPLNSDTSNITKFKFNDYSVFVDLISLDSIELANIINNINKTYGKDSFNILVRIFDDSVESIEPIRLDDSSLAFRFKRVNQNEMLVNASYLKERLSSGTYKGIYLFASSLIAFSIGGNILIDEIEKSFNRNLIENLFILFEDKRINKMSATLIYSTHYAELLDYSSRCDNINVLHRCNDKISIKNLSSSYRVRIDLSKSKQFEQNAFDNLINYERLMDLRRVLIK